MSTFDHIKFGDNLKVTDESGGVIRVDAGPGAATTPGHTIADEGAALTQRATLDFAGAGVTVTDVAGSAKTLVTIPGAAGPTITYSALSLGPPASPADGDVWYATHAGGVWMFRYNAGGGTYKWEYVGGSDAESNAPGAGSANFNNAWGDLGGPTHTVVRAGNYDVSFGADAQIGTTADTAFTGVALGATTPTFAVHQSNAGGFWNNLSGSWRFLGVTAGAVLTQRYMAGNQVTIFNSRWLRVRPVAIS